MNYREQQRELRERLAGPAYQTGISPEATAHLIEAIATDKALRMRTVSNATVIMMQMPVWVRAEEARALFGVPSKILVEMVKEGKVTGRKMDVHLRGSATIYKTETILKAIDALPDYRRWLLERPDLEEPKGRKAKQKKGNGK